jgi:hypothetical protein
LEKSPEKLSFLLTLEIFVVMSLEGANHIPAMPFLRKIVILRVIIFTILVKETGMLFNRVIKIFLIGMVVFILATITYAYAASNTVTAGKVGSGAATITGYAVSGVTYTLDSNNPVNITAVAFTLDAGATTVKVRLVTGGTLFPCTGGPTNWSCTITGVTATAANNLEVNAAQ